MYEYFIKTMRNYIVDRGGKQAEVLKSIGDTVNAHVVRKPPYYIGTPTTTNTGTYFPPQKDTEEWVRELYMLIGRFDSSTGHYMGMKQFDIQLLIHFIRQALATQRQEVEEIVENAKDDMSGTYDYDRIAEGVIEWLRTKEGRRG